MCGEIYILFKIPRFEQFLKSSCVRICGVHVNIKIPTHINKKRQYKRAIVITNVITSTITYNQQRKRQMERLWRKEKSLLRRANLRKQVHFYNGLVSNAKSRFYSKQIEKNKNDPKKLWQELNKTLHRSTDCVLPDHDSE